MYTVYQHKNKINGKVYIGITMQEPEKRWGVNGRNYKSSPHFYSAIQKYGWDNFEHNILFTNLTKEEACLKEQEKKRDKNFHKTIQIKRKCIVRSLIKYLSLCNNVVENWGYRQQVFLVYVEEEAKLAKDTI